MRTSESGFRLGFFLLVERAERMLFCVIATAGLGVIAMVGCHRNAAPTAASESASNPAANTGPDPAQANLAPVSGSGATQVLGQSQQAPTSQSSQEYMQQQAAPIERQAPPDQGQGYQDQGDTDQDADAGYQATLTDEQANEPPPPLPVYDQPEDPDPNDIWTPGYWAYGPGGYYWVPGAWCAPPYIGALWTPGYWAFYGGHYRFHHGFWGPHIGYYGGVNYGFGYVGVGYLGGYWNGPHFYYNQNFNRVGPGVRNVYARDETFNNVHYNSYAVNSRLGPRVSYNGGKGGVRYTPRPAELAAVREQRIAPMPSQVQAQREAGQNRQQFYTANHGRPAIAAAPRPFAAERGIAAPARTGTQPRPGQSENRPAPMLNRPGQPALQARPGQPERTAGGRPGESRVGNPQPQAPPRSEIRRVPQGQFQPRPAQPEPARPAAPSRPQPQQFARPQEPARQAQPHPEPQVRQPQPEARQPQMRPQPERRAQPQARPEPQARPQPQMQPRPQAPPQPRPQHEEEHPKP